MVQAARYWNLGQLKKCAEVHMKSKDQILLYCEADDRYMWVFRHGAESSEA